MEWKVEGGVEENVDEERGCKKESEEEDGKQERKERKVRTTKEKLRGVSAEREEWRVIMSAEDMGFWLSVVLHTILPGWCVCVCVFVCDKKHTMHSLSAWED